MNDKLTHPGPVILFGSGETAPTGRKVIERLFNSLPTPIHTAVLETPAGFQPNSAWVASQVLEFLETRLQNFSQKHSIIPARKKGTPESPENPEILQPLYHADLLFMGAGSPTYAAYQLENSLAWKILTGRHRSGTAVVLASAAAIAISKYTLPVYEIYKAGADLHWHNGLDLFGHYGLNLVVIPHWNNKEGGKNLDTSRCFMGEDRFKKLRGLLPNDASCTLVGIDEHTALIFDFIAQECRVSGKGKVHLFREDQKSKYSEGQSFSFSALGHFSLPLEATLHPEIWAYAQEPVQIELDPETPPQNVLDLMRERQAAREAKNWSHADLLRDQINNTGWEIIDTPTGPELAPAKKNTS